MIAYVDSSVLARVYLADEAGHEDATALLDDPGIGRVTGTWTRIEVSGALVRAARSGHGDERGLLALLDGDLSSEGRVTVIAVDQVQVESRALHLVRQHAIRAMDAWHLAVAAITLPKLAEADEPLGFATRDRNQAAVANLLGFEVM